MKYDVEIIWLNNLQKLVKKKSKEYKEIEKIKESFKVVRDFYSAIEKLENAGNEN
ncbi:MAG: hypothetical protein IKE01_04170 [Clostridia bacterium]|nr:hypothetical protein [Clostridia bacterium]